MDEKEAKIVQTGVAVIENSIETLFSEFMKIQHHLRNFFSLAMMSPCYPLHIQGRTKINDSPEEYANVSIYYSNKTPDTIKGIFDLHMLFRYRDISANFEEYLKNWFSKVEILEPVFNLYFGTLYNSDMYLDHIFLSTIQALESYHRRTMKNYVWSENDFTTIKSEVLNGVSKKYKDWVTNKFQYGNEPSLRRRIKELLEEFNEIFGEFSIYDSKFAEDITNSRNYLTHYDSTLKDKSLKDQELFNAIQKLRALIEVCFMKQIGVNNDKMKIIMKRSLQNKSLIPMPS